MQTRTASKTLGPIRQRSKGAPAKFRIYLGAVRVGVNTSVINLIVRFLHRNAGTHLLLPRPMANKSGPSGRIDLSTHRLPTTGLNCAFQSHCRCNRARNAGRNSQHLPRTASGPPLHVNPLNCRPTLIPTLPRRQRRLVTSKVSTAAALRRRRAVMDVAVPSMIDTSPASKSRFSHEFSPTFNSCISAITSLPFSTRTANWVNRSSRRVPTGRVNAPSIRTTTATRESVQQFVNDSS